MTTTEYTETAMADRFKAGQAQETEQRDVLALTISKVMSYVQVYDYDRHTPNHREIAQYVTRIAMDVSDFVLKQGKFAMYWDEQERNEAFIRSLRDKVDMIEGFANDMKEARP